MKNPLLAILLLVAAAAAYGDPGPIRLKNATIDPKASALQSEETLACSPTQAGKRNYIVQPRVNFSPEELEGLSGYGMKVVGHLPPNSYIIQANPSGMETFMSECKPLYVGEYRPEYKIDGTLLQAGEASLSSHEGFKAVWIGLAEYGEWKSAKADLENLGAKSVFLVSKKPAMLRAALPESAIMQAACLSSVLSLQKCFKAKAMNYYSHKEKNLNSEVMNTLGYCGEGEKILVCDTGLDSGDMDNLHPDLQDMAIDAAVGILAQQPEEEGGYGRSATDWYDYHGHGTHVTGIALGRGTVDHKPHGEAFEAHRFPGVAPKAALGILAMGDFVGDYLLEETEDDLDLFYKKGYRICNNSWGGGEFGDYDSLCILYDSYVWDHPELLMLYVAGNDNMKIDVEDNCTVTSPAPAKNGITVANAEVWNEECQTRYSKEESEPYADDLWTWPWDNANQGMDFTSSHGPCNDGRIKPDLAAPGCWITSLLAYRDDKDRSKLYVEHGGTSMATPNVSGCAAIVREYLRKSRDLSNPSAALVKAILINGCRSMGIGQFTNKIDPATGQPYVEIPDTTPNCVSGYGHVNLEESLMPAAGSLELLEGSLAASGKEAAYVFSKAQAGPVKITLCWTDYPGTEAAAQALVNDLDLEIAYGGKTYYAGGTTEKSDSINNVEQYSNASFPAGENITVRVRGYNIMQGPQPFALAVSGLAQVPEPAFLGLLGLLGVLLIRRNRETAK